VESCAHDAVGEGLMKASWQTADPGTHTSVRWTEWLDGRRRIDPYLVWADLTAFAGLGGLDPGDKLAVLVESAELPVFEGKGTPPVFAEIDVPDVYKPARPGTPSPRRFFTARVRAESVPMLLSCGDVVRRFQLGLPRIPFTTVGVVPGSFPQVNLERIYPEVVMGVIDDGCAIPHPQFVQDSPVSFSVLKAGSSRVRYLWDQGQHVDSAPANAARPAAANRFKTPDLLGYGGEWGPDEIDRLMASTPAQGFDQLQAYAAAGYRRMKWRFPLHGTGVLDLACGKLPPMDPTRAARLSAAGRTPDAPPDADAVPDKAGQAPAVFVQLPVPTVLDTSGGSLGVHLVDGVLYILAKAYQLNRKTEGPIALMAGRMTASTERAGSSEAVPAAATVVGGLSIGIPPRVVITASFGSVAGPHDGTSMVEMALAELTQTMAGLALVAAAGNAHGSRTHAALGLEAAPDVAPLPDNVAKGQRAVSALAPGTWREVDWEIAPDNPHESYLEIWIEEDTAEGVLVSLQPPLGAPPIQAQVGDAKVLLAPDAVDGRRLPMAGVIYAKRVAQGLKGTMILLAVGPTMPSHRMPAPDDLDVGDDPAARPRPGVARDPAPSGAWRVTVHNQLARRVSVHLWTERNDLVGRRRRQQQSRLQDVGPQSVQSDHSLGTLANGSPQPARGQVWVVGGYRLSDGKMAPYSSGGPSRAPSTRLGPDVEAPSDMAVSMPGLRVAGVSWGAYSRLGGTSAAAPLLARWIANHWTGRDPASLAALIESSLPAAAPDRLADVPPWPQPMPTGHDDAPRRGRRRL
jgi:Subtilase family